MAGLASLPVMGRDRGWLFNLWPKMRPEREALTWLSLQIPWGQWRRTKGPVILKAWPSFWALKWGLRDHLDSQGENQGWVCPWACHLCFLSLIFHWLMNQQSVYQSILMCLLSSYCVLWPVSAQCHWVTGQVEMPWIHELVIQFSLEKDSSRHCKKITEKILPGPVVYSSKRDTCSFSLGIQKRPRDTNSRSKGQKKRSKKISISPRKL